MTVRVSLAGQLLKYLALPAVVPTVLFAVVIWRLGEPIWPTSAIGGVAGLLVFSVPHFAVLLPFGIREVRTRGQVITITYALGRVVRLPRREILETRTQSWPILREIMEIIKITTTEGRLRVATVGLTERQRNVLKRLLRPLPAHSAAARLARELAGAPRDAPLVFVPRYDPVPLLAGLVMVAVSLTAVVLDARDGSVETVLLVGLLLFLTPTSYLWLHTYRRIRFESTIVIERWLLPRRVMRYDELVEATRWSGLKTRRGRVLLSNMENKAEFDAFVTEARRRGLWRLPEPEFDLAAWERQFRIGRAFVSLAWGSMAGLFAELAGGMLGLVSRPRVFGVVVGVGVAALAWFVMERRGRSGPGKGRPTT